LTFSCKTRGFCPSCHAKRLEEWGEWVRETLLFEVPHRQVVLKGLLSPEWAEMIRPRSFRVFDTRPGPKYPSFCDGKGRFQAQGEPIRERLGKANPYPY